MEDLFVNCLSVESILGEQGIYSLTSNLNFFLTTNFKAGQIETTLGLACLQNYIQSLYCVFMMFGVPLFLFSRATWSK